MDRSSLSAKDICIHHSWATMEEAANFDIGLEDFDHEFGFLMDD